MHRPGELTEHLTAQLLDGRSSVHRRSSQEEFFPLCRDGLGAGLRVESLPRTPVRDCGVWSSATALASHSEGPGLSIGGPRNESWFDWTPVKV